MSPALLNMAEPDLSSMDALLAGGIEAMHENVALTMEKSLGRPIPEVEVCFQDLHVSARLPVAKPGSQGPHVPTIWTQIQQDVMKLFSRQATAEKKILSGITGVFKPTRITLVLGHPGSGKSSLLKILSGRFPMDQTIHVSGDITYNGKPRAEVLSRLPRFAGYTNQKDDHQPTLTVQQTFEFAHECCEGTGLEPWIVKALEDLPEDKRESAVKVMMALHQFAADIRVQMLGLSRCKDTMVGNAMLRGVSGGERKRVTTGEMTFGHKRVMLLDEISTGLDAATTFDIVKSLKSLARNVRSNIVVSLLQPPPEVFNLFDDVLILNSGRITYHGRCDQVQDYFEGMGFHCPPRKDVADFLLDLGTDKQHAYITDKDSRVPSTSADFADRFQQSKVFQETLQYLQGERKSNPKEFDPLQDPRVFRQSLAGDLVTLLRRQIRISLLDRVFLLGRAVMVVVMGLLYGSTFWQMNDANSQLVLGLLFSCTLFLSMGQAAQVPTFVEARSVFYKQRGANFFRSLAYVLASSLTQIPLAITETLIFGSIVYWMGGYVVLADRFLSFLTTLFLCQMWFTSFFFFISAAAPSITIAQPVMMVCILFCVLFGGFLLSKNDIPDYFVWFYWIDPIAWSIRSLSVNQYLAPKFDVCVYGGIDYCARFGTTFGKYSLELSGLPTSASWVYFGWLYFVCGYLVLVVAAHLMLENKRFESPGSTTIVQVDIDVEEGSTANIEPEPRDNVFVRVKTPRSRAPPVILAFHDLWYSVPMPGGKKGDDIDLLQGVSGFAKPKTMTALMGSSGAGKTTLMDVIASRKTGGKIRGEILLNGYPATEQAIRRCTGYCEQMDIHSESATFREALVFSAMLRQSASVSPAEKMESVDECIALLELEAIADKIIRGSSTEQMKRLTIGVELVAQPSVIFMDEPTSGLDARSAKLIMNGVRKIADSGRTIVCTIHQPSSEVFSLFDSLLLLRRGGRMVYFGELGEQSRELINYFQAAPGVKPIEPGYNPATWMLECIGAGVSSGPSDSVDFAEHFLKSALRAEMDKNLNQNGLLSTGLPQLTFEHQFASRWTTQFSLLCRRFGHMYWRTPTYNLTRLAISMMLGALMGVIYQSTDYATFTGINAGVGLVFISTVFLGIIGFNSVMPVAAEERIVFYRERSSETYHALWYFIAGTLVEIPYVLLSTMCFCIIFFPSVGFTGFSTFIYYWLMVSLNALLFVYLGQLLVFALPSMAVASTAGALLSSIFMLFAGFNPPANNIPTGYKWIYYLSPPTYSIAALVALIFADCPDGSTGGLSCKTLKNSPPTVGNITLKQYVEGAFNMKYDLIPRNVLVLCALIVAFRLLALLSLRYISHLKR
jgi:ABC-type multidrug transport system ATPase subunit/ABC-type multidrug transport system permease subunit